MSEFLTRRGSTWHFVRRVPAEFAALDPRGIIRHSTRVADDRVGGAQALDAELERFWMGLADGASAAHAKSYDDVPHRARSLGFDLSQTSS